MCKVLHHTMKLYIASDNNRVFACVCVSFVYSIASYYEKIYGERRRQTLSLRCVYNIMEMYMTSDDDKLCLCAVCTILYILHYVMEMYKVRDKDT